MTKRRIIPCLDIKDGRVVKGVNFVNLKDAGDPVETIKFYSKQGADELVLLDITATNEKRRTMIDVVEKAANEISIPLTVGGGIRTVEDFGVILKAGADKVGVNSAAVLDKSIIKQAADNYGSYRIVIAIDAKREGDSYFVYISGGRKRTSLDAVEWAKEAEYLGAGEILLTSMDADGTKNGYDIELTRMVSEAVNIPVIASGGGGNVEHFYDVLTAGKADAALAATLFHYRELTVGMVKEYLRARGIEVRM